jgi:hypothetical protein
VLDISDIRQHLFFPSLILFVGRGRGHNPGFLQLSWIGDTHFFGYAGLNNIDVHNGNCITVTGPTCPSLREPQGTNRGDAPINRAKPTLKPTELFSTRCAA